jgi:hypothetical protein
MVEGHCHKVGNGVKLGFPGKPGSDLFTHVGPPTGGGGVLG